MASHTAWADLPGAPPSEQQKEQNQVSVLNAVNQRTVKAAAVTS